MDTIYTAATRSAETSAGVVVFLVLFYLAILGLALWVYAKIVSKAGYPWPWVFMMFVPIANLVFLCLFAFKPWPIERELAATRHALQMATGSPYPGGQLGGPFGGQPGGYGGYPGVDGGYGSQGGAGGQGGFGDQGGFGGQGGYGQQGPSDNPYGPKS